MPLVVTALYVILLGLVTLSPGMVRGLFGYEIKEPGLLLVLSAAFLGSGVILWGIAGDPQRHGGLATSVVINLVILVVFLLWGVARNLFTWRNIVIPLLINLALAVWISTVKESREHTPLAP